AEARRLDGGDAQAAAQLVDHQGGQGFAFDVLGDDQQGPTRLNHGFQHRQHRLQRGQLLLVEQDERLLEDGLHLVRAGDEVGRQVAAVELHALDDVDGGFGGLGFFDGDDAFVADLGHGLGDQVADFSVAVGRDGADLGDFRVVGDRLGVRLDLFQHRFDSLVDAALQVHRVHAGGHGLQAFLNDGLGQDGGGGGAVARLVVRLGSDFADHLGAHVLEGVFQLDFLGHRDAVLGRARGAEGLLDHDVAALRTQGHLDGVSQDVDALQHLVASVGVELYDFSGHAGCSYLDVFTRETGNLERVLRQHAQDVGFLHDDQVFAVDLDLGAGPLAEQDAVAGLQL